MILTQRQSKGEQVAVIVLLGLDETTTEATFHDFHFIKQATLEAELDFFAPWFNGQHSMKMGSEKESVLKESVPKTVD
jgi:hypothetical protein